MKLLIKNGRLLNPATNTDDIYDVLIDGKTIQKVDKLMEAADAKVVDASGCYVMPGFIDLHVHLRDPGLEYKETVETGGKAAAAGGFTTICAMPNTKPVIDSPEMIRYVHDKADQESPVHVYQLGAVTIGQAGTELADIKGMAAAGAKAISEDGKSVMDIEVYRKGMIQAAEAGIPVFAHCEDIDLVKGGVMNADEKAAKLGLPGITNAVEDVIVERDIRLSKETGARLHLCHCSTKDSVRLLREAQAAGIEVSGEVCPHHFTLSTDDIVEDDGNYKMNPPLRSKEDVEALKQAIADGVIGAIATDHAPHSEDEKNKSMKEAMFGITGLETAASLTWSELVETGLLTPLAMADRMSHTPAHILGVDKGDIQEGKAADIVIFDPQKIYAIDVNESLSKSKNTPFHGRQVKGKVICTIVDGKVVYKNRG